MPQDISLKLTSRHRYAYPKLIDTCTPTHVNADPGIHVHRHLHTHTRQFYTENVCVCVCEREREREREKERERKRERERERVHNEISMCTQLSSFFLSFFSFFLSPRKYVFNRKIDLSIYINNE